MSFKFYPTLSLVIFVCITFAKPSEETIVDDYVDAVRNNVPFAIGNLNVDQQIFLAYRIKKIMDEPQFSSLSEAEQKPFENFKRFLPRSIRGLIWNGDNCRIRNAQTNEYLYAASDQYAQDKDRRKVFTWKRKNQVTEGDWKFIPLENKDPEFPEGVSFAILNLRWNEYLFNAYYQPKISGQRDSPVYTWRPGGLVTNGIWRITTWHNNERFVIYNLEKSRRLWSDPDESRDIGDRRNVLAYPFFPADNAWNEWYIDC